MRQVKRVGAAALALTIHIGAPALASDGRIVITQAAALAGGVTPGDKPGFPVSITESGSYRLGSNLWPTARRSAIVVSPEAQDVTIDLNGFALKGRNKAKHGITFGNDAIRSLEVRNGATAEFADSAIDVSRSTIGVFENLRIHSNGGDGILTGQDARISNNTIATNMGRGSNADTVI